MHLPVLLAPEQAMVVESQPQVVAQTALALHAILHLPPSQTGVDAGHLQPLVQAPPTEHVTCKRSIEMAHMSGNPPLHGHPANCSWA